MPESSPALFGVLVTYRRLQDLQETMDRLLGQSRPLDGLLVIDNGSDHRVAELVRMASHDHVTYVDAGENLGPAGGFALGVERLLPAAADGDWIFLLDDDDPPFFDDAFEKAARFGMKMVATTADLGGIGISGGRFDFDTGAVRRIDDREIEGAVEVDHITGGGLPGYRVAAIRAVGPPRSELFFGFEELEYGLRLTSAGFRLFADGEEWKRRKKVKREEGLLPPEHVSIARSEQTNWRVSDPSWRRYYSLRNLTFILRSHGRSWTAIKVGLSRGLAKPIVNLFVTPGPAWRNLQMNARALRDGWLGRMGRTIDPD